MNRKNLMRSALSAHYSGDKESTVTYAERVLMSPIVPGEELVLGDGVTLGHVLHCYGLEVLAAAIYETTVAQLSTGARGVDLDIARYARAEHLIQTRQFQLAIEVLGEIHPGSLTYPHSRALMAFAMRALCLPDADAVADEARAAANDDQRPRVELLLAHGAAERPPE